MNKKREGWSSAGFESTKLAGLLGSQLAAFSSLTLKGNRFYLQSLNFLVPPPTHTQQLLLLRATSKLFQVVSVVSVELL